MAQTMHAFKGFLGVGYHASSQTDLRQAVVARAYFNRFHDLDVQHKQGEEMDPTSGRSEAESVSLGNYDLQATGTLESSTEGCVPLLARSLMGGAFADSTVGTTGKQHLLQIADTVPSNARLSCEVRYGTNAESITFNAVCKSLGFKLDSAGYAKWPFKLVGSTPTYLGTPTTPTFPDPLTLLSQRNTTFTFDGATTHIARNLSWSLERKLDEDDYDVTSRQRRDAGYGDFIATFDAELSFQTLAQFRRFWGGSSATTPADTDTEFAVNISTARSDVIAGGTAKHTAELDLPKAFLTAVGNPMKGKDAIRQKVQGRSIYSASSTYGAQLKLISTVSSYP